MNHAVVEEVLKKTKRCPNGFSCLGTGKGKCKVYDVDGEDILFVSNPFMCHCRYRLYFGEHLLCVCPTHYAFNKIIKNEF